MGKKLRKAIKRLSKDLDEAREENRELIEGLAERMTEVLELQAEANLALTETLESYLSGLDRDVREEPAGEPDGDPAFTEEDEEPVEQDEEPQEPEVTEAAERKASELGVDLDEVKGTGSGGRILVKDVEDAAG